MTKTPIAKDHVARVHYTGTLPDTGEVFDTSEGRDPLAYLVGHGKMIPRSWQNDPGGHGKMTPGSWQTDPGIVEK